MTAETKAQRVREGVLHNGRWRSALLASDAPSWAKLLGCALAEHGWSTGAIFPANPLLQEQTSMSLAQVKRARRWLTANGWISRTPGDGRRPTLYTLRTPVENDVERGLSDPPPGSGGPRRGVQENPEGGLTDPRRNEGRRKNPGKDYAGAARSAAPPAPANCARHLLPLMDDGACRGCRADQLAGEEA